MKRRRIISDPPLPRRSDHRREWSDVAERLESHHALDPLRWIIIDTAPTKDEKSSLGYIRSKLAGQGVYPELLQRDLPPRVDGQYPGRETWARIGPTENRAEKEDGR